MSALDQLFAFARAQLGKPYGWGAQGPSAYDCSGLTEKAYAAAGVSLPRTSQEQRNAGVGVSLSQIQAGDLVTFTYNDGAGNPGPGNHVAIYAGSGQVYEAARPGVPIRLAPLDVAHVDRVRRVLGGAGGSTTATPADSTTSNSGGTAPATLQQAGYDAVINITPWGIPLNPFKLPGYLWGKAQQFGNGAVGGLGVGNLADSLGPVLLAATGVAAGVVLVVLGAYVTVKPEIDSGLDTVGKLSAVK